MTDSKRTYEAAGVSIRAGEEAVERIKTSVRTTFGPQVLGDIGGFGGLFAIGDQYRDPVLVSTTDGVGTKSLIATMLARYDTIGEDLVAMCVDDLVCTGATPLFFLDYLAVGSLDPEIAAELVEGVAAGCRHAGASLIGGEMAEHPGMMKPGEFDLVGFAVGVVERDAMIDGSSVAPGDVLIGLASPGIRSNGYSLARHIFFDCAHRTLDDRAWEATDAPSLGEELLRPSVIYAPAIVELVSHVEVHSIAHITGGGIPGNLNRVLNAHCDAVVERSAWSPPRIFEEMQTLGHITDEEMFNVFNMGIGMVVVVEEEMASRTIAVLTEHGVDASKIGVIVPGTGRVQLR